MINTQTFCLVNETALKQKRTIKIKDHFSYCKNRDKAKGGVGTVIPNYLKPHTTKVAEGKEGDEYLITRLDHVVPALNIVNIYGEQESRTGKDQILSSWLKLTKDLEEIEDRKEAVLIFGDLNRAIGSDEWGISGNHDRVLYGGELVRDMLKNKDYVLLKGGPWTWVQRGKEWIRSCLDLAIGSANLVPFVKQILIDKNRKFTPRRVIRRKGKIHFSFLSGDTAEGHAKKCETESGETCCMEYRQTWWMDEVQRSY